MMMRSMNMLKRLPTMVNVTGGSIRQFSTPAAYVAHTRTTGGRDGFSENTAKTFRIHLVKPKELGGTGAAPANSTGPASNPEELFASGYSACFLGAMGLAAKLQKKSLPSDTSIDANVALYKREDEGFKIGVELNIRIPNVSNEEAKAIVEHADRICPYSHATRNNISIKLNVV